jgi:O-glycosyl hydrolase
MFQRCKRQLISGLAALLIVSAFIGVQFTHTTATHAASTITIDPSQQYQTIQGWGTSMAWWANIIGGWSDSQRAPLADALYDPNKGIGLNVVRYNFGADGPGNTCHNQMREGGNVPSFEPTQGNYVWTNDANQLWFAQAAKARGANVFEGFVNSAPAWMLKNSCTAGGPNGTENLSSAHYSDYANYIATIAKHFHDSFGITLQTVDAFNEPSGTWWNSTNSQEGMFVSPATQNTIVNLLGPALSQNGASAYTSISAPDDENVWASIDAFNSYSSTAKSYVTQWNTHTYGTSAAIENTAYTTIGQTDQKRLWMSEWGVGSQGSPIAAALTLSKEITTDEQNLHPVAWVGWQAVNGLMDHNDDLWGLAYRDSNNTISYLPRYYAMGNYSKFVRPGFKMIGNNDANTFTAYNAATKSLVIVATNSNTSSAAVNYNLANFGAVGPSATPYQTTASEKLAQLATVGISNKTFSTTLPAQSITTFVIPNVTISGGTGGTPTPTPTPVSGSGYYKLVNRNSGQALDISGASTANGGLAIQWPYSGGSNQQWKEVSVNGGYKLVNRNSGLLLDDPGYTKTAGTQIDQWSDSNGNNQWWNLVSAGNGYYYIVNQASGLYVDVSGASAANGATVDLWTSTSGNNQQWQLVAV